MTNDRSARARWAWVAGWGYVLALAAAAPWLGQGGNPCPPGPLQPGEACPAILYGPSYVLLVVAALTAVGLLRPSTSRGSIGWLLAASALGIWWSATHRFLGTASGVPRLAVVLAVGVPPLLMVVARAGERHRSPEVADVGRAG